MRNAREFGAVVLLCVAGAVVYGILHDLVTAHVCVEYFTVAHPRIIRSESPILLALAWGVVATWWMGAGLGVALGLACRVGRWPRLSARALVRPVCLLLGVMAPLAILAGVAGFVLGSSGFFRIPQAYGGRIPVAHHARFFAAAGAHMVSCSVGAFGGAVLVGWALGRRQGASIARQGEPGRTSGGLPGQSV